MTPLFLMMLIGIILAKTGNASLEFIKGLTNFCFLVLFPASSIKAFSINVTGDMLRDSMVLILLGVLGIWGPCVLGYLIQIIFKPSIKQSNIIIYSLMFSNTGFIGVGIVLSLYGSEGLFYKIMFNIAFSIAFYSYGIYIMQRGGEKRDGKSIMKLFVSPPFVGLAIGLVLLITQIKLPDFLLETSSLLVGCLAPIGMLVLGMSIAQFKLSDMLERSPAYFIAFMRLLVIPLSMAYIMRICGVRGLPLLVSMLALAMPVATNCSLLAQKYDGDTKLAGQSVLISTVLSVFTIPLVLYITERFIA